MTSDLTLAHSLRYADFRRSMEGQEKKVRKKHPGNGIKADQRIIFSSEGMAVAVDDLGSNSKEKRDPSLLRPMSQKICWDIDACSRNRYQD